MCKLTGKPCKGVEHYLFKVKVYRREWIRPKVSELRRVKFCGSNWREIPFSIFSDSFRRRIGDLDTDSEAKE